MLSSAAELSGVQLAPKRILRLALQENDFSNVIIIVVDLESHALTKFSSSAKELHRNALSKLG